MLMKPSRRTVAVRTPMIILPSLVIPSASLLIVVTNSSASLRTRNGYRSSRHTMKGDDPLIRRVTQDRRRRGNPRSHVFTSCYPIQLAFQREKIQNERKMSERYDSPL
ncbi:hypothetical protein OH77DRAFT_288079 [Trametes cingulata]|nr:hypothetical protein OH77DRAFT_288079 [Trametes cingulata]